MMNEPKTRGEMTTERSDGGRRPRSAFGLMVLLALPFLIESGVSTARQIGESETPPPATQIIETHAADRLDIDRSHG